MGSGQSFNMQAEKRKSIEMREVKMVLDHFRSDGFFVLFFSVNQSYDLRCTKDKKDKYVEVKGTTTEGKKIILTRNEIEFARTHKDDYFLFIVSNMICSK